GANAAPPAGNGGPMRAADLDLKELLDVDPERAIVRFAGQRVLILDTIAMGILRKELLESLGQTAARALLTRFGYAYGWRAAEALKKVEEQLGQRRRELTRTAGAVEDPSGLTVNSDAMRRVVDLARRVAKVESTVLVTGESGSGKERIARLIHDESARAAGPF